MTMGRSEARDMQVLDLPKSGISLHREEMLKYGPEDAVVARYPTERIVRIGLETTRELGMPIVLISVFVALAYVAHAFVASPGLAWTGVIVCLGVCGIVLLSIEGRRIVIETTNGTVAYPVQDLFEEAEGFVLSANSLLELDAETRSDGERLLAAAR
jgi:hypothetical protein